MTTADAKATQEAKELLEYLKNTAGQQIITGQHTQTIPCEEIDYIRQTTGKSPSCVASSCWGILRISIMQTLPRNAWRKWKRIKARQRQKLLHRAYRFRCDESITGRHPGARSVLRRHGCDRRHPATFPGREHPHPLAPLPRILRHLVLVGSKGRESRKRLIPIDVRLLCYLPDVDLLQKSRIPWAYYMTWSKEFCIGEKYNSVENLKKMYDSEYAVTLL